MIKQTSAMGADWKRDPWDKNKRALKSSVGTAVPGGPPPTPSSPEEEYHPQPASTYAAAAQEPEYPNSEREYSVFDEEIDEVDRLIKKASSNTKEAFPSSEEAQRIRQLRHWKGLLKSQRDELTRLPSSAVSTQAAEEGSRYEEARRALGQDTMPSYAASAGSKNPPGPSPVASSYAASAGVIKSEEEREREGRLREVGQAHAALPFPSVGERLGLTLSGAGKEYAGSMAQAGASAVDVMGLDQIINHFSGSTGAPIPGPLLKLATIPLEKKLVDTAQAFSDRASESAAQDIARAQEGLDPMGKMLINAGAAVAQMGGDAAIALATGGSSMLPMVIRAFGGGVQEARAKGYDENQQLLLGLTNAATEYFTERLFGGNPVYDTDAGLINRMVGKLVKNPKVMEFLSSAPVEKVAEGLEEMVSDVLNPLAEWAITGTRPEYELDQIVENGITGVIAAVMAGGGSKVVNKVGQGLTSLVSDATADKMLLERTTVDFLTRKGGLKLTKGMTQEQRRAAVRQAVENVVHKEKAASMGEAGKPRITMTEFTDPSAPIWTNVEYGDTVTQAKITQDVHREMVDAGWVVQISQGTKEKVTQSYPDLRGMKKVERLPILRQKMTELKNSLRSFLGGFKDTDIEFDVKGKVLEARLYDTGIREVLEKVTQDKASMLYESGEIFKNAQYLYSTPDYDGDPNVYRWNYFYTPVQIGDDVVGVRIAVRDMVPSVDGKMDSQIYNWGIKKGTALDDGGPG